MAYWRTWAVLQDTPPVVLPDAEDPSLRRSGMQRTRNFEPHRTRHREGPYEAQALTLHFSRPTVPGNICPSASPFERILSLCFTSSLAFLLKLISSLHLCPDLSPLTLHTLNTEHHYSTRGFSQDGRRDSPARGCPTAMEQSCVEDWHRVLFCQITGMAGPNEGRALLGTDHVQVGQ